MTDGVDLDMIGELNELARELVKRCDRDLNVAAGKTWGRRQMAGRVEGRQEAVDLIHELAGRWLREAETRRGLGTG